MKNEVDVQEQKHGNLRIRYYRMGKSWYVYDTVTQTTIAEFFRTAEDAHDWCDQFLTR